MRAPGPDAALVVFAVAISALLAFGQLHAAAQAPPPRGSLSGRVETTDASPVPVRRALVILNASDPDVHRTVAADDDGHFTFSGLPAGRYTLTAAKPPFVTMSYGASTPGKLGLPIVLAAGAGRSDLVVRLMRGAVITGRVLDPTGQPAPLSEHVSVLRRSLTEFGPALAAVEAGYSWAGTEPTWGATTDDRGMYRFFGLAPGEYVVVAALRTTQTYQAVHQITAQDLNRAAQLLREPPPASSRASEVAPFPQRAPGPLAAAPDAVTEAPTYYPDTVVAAEAAAIAVRAGEEKDGIDVRLHLAHGANLLATFQDPLGRLPASGRAHLIGNEIPGANNTSAQLFDLASGLLRRPGLMPGHYVIEATGTMPNPAGGTTTLWGSAALDVNGQDVTDLALTLQPTAQLAGHLVFDEALPTAPRVEVTLVPADPVAGSFVTTLTARVDQDRFSFPTVPPGRGTAFGPSAMARRTSAPWQLASATVGGADAADAPVTIGPAPGPDTAVLTLTRRAAELQGALQDVGGHPTAAYTVVVFSADPANWALNSRRIRAVHLATDASFALRDLPPGEYLVAALTDVEPSDWFNPEFLRTVEASAVKVMLTAGSRTVQNLRIAGTPR